MKEIERLQRIKEKTVDQGDRLGEVLRRRRLRSVRPGSFAETLSQAGVGISAQIWLCGSFVLSVAVGWGLFLTIGPLAIFIAAVFCYSLSVAYPRWSADRRREAAIQDLPLFIKGVEAAVLSGRSVERALRISFAQLPPGTLKMETEQVCRLIDNRVPFEEAVSWLVRTIAGQEILSLAVTLQLFCRSSGRLSHPLAALANRVVERREAIEQAALDGAGARRAFYAVLAVSLAAPLLLIAAGGPVNELLVTPMPRFLIEAAAAAELACLVSFRRLIELPR